MGHQSIPKYLDMQCCFGGRMDHNEDSDRYALSRASFDCDFIFRITTRTTFGYSMMEIPHSYHVCRAMEDDKDSCGRGTCRRDIREYIIVNISIHNHYKEIHDHLEKSTDENWLPSKENVRNIIVNHNKEKHGSSIKTVSRDNFAIDQQTMDKIRGNIGNNNCTNCNGLGVLYISYTYKLDSKNIW